MTGTVGEHGGLTGAGAHAVVSDDGLFLQQIVRHRHVTGLQVNHLK